MVKYVLFVIGLILSFENIYAQNQTAVDSLTLLLEHSVGNDRYFPFVDLAIEHVDHDNEKALSYIEESEKVALLAQDSSWIIRSRRIRVQILSRLERFKEAIDLAEITLKAVRRNTFPRELLYLKNTLGLIQLSYGRYDKALQSNFETHELAISLEDTFLIAQSLRNIGVTYYKLKDYDKGLKYFKKALHLSNPTDDNGLGLLTNISLCYTYLNDLENARKYIYKGLNLCGKNCPNIPLMHIKYALGCIALRSRQYATAEGEFLQSYKLAREVYNHRMQFDNIYYLAEIYLYRKATGEALRYLTKAEQIMDKGAPFNLERLKIYSKFSQAYFLLNDHKKVAGYQRRYINLRDSIYDEALTTNLMKIESDFHQRENVKTISAQNEVLLLNERIIKAQQTLNIVTILLALITASFLVLVFRNLKRKKQVNRLLDEKISERTFELQLSRNQLLTSLTERDIMIARTSQEINQAVGTIKGLCTIASHEIDDPKLRLYIHKIHSASSQLNEHIKDMIPSQDALANKRTI